MAKGKEVAAAASGVPAVYDYGDMAGAGFEDIKSTDLAIPFINLLQNNSPLVEEEKGNPGQFHNSVTGEVTDLILMQPVFLDEVWVEWRPRHMGGGIVELHRPDSELVANILAENGGSRIPPKGADGKRIPFAHGENEVVETHYVYGMLLNHDGSDHEGFALLPFSSTKIKPYRNWTSAMFMLKGQPPIFANRAQVRSKREKNTEGSFFNYDIRPFNDSSWGESLINPAEQRHLLDGAVKFKEMIDSGQAKADIKSQTSATEGTDEDDDTPF